jgi:hypothetical protein
MTNLHQSHEIEANNFNLVGLLAQAPYSDFTVGQQEGSRPAVSTDPFFSPPVVNTSLSIGVILALTYFVKALGELVHPRR